MEHGWQWNITEYIKHQQCGIWVCTEMWPQIRGDLERRWWSHSCVLSQNFKNHFPQSKGRRNLTMWLQDSRIHQENNALQPHYFAGFFVGAGRKWTTKCQSELGALDVLWTCTVADCSQTWRLFEITVIILLPKKVIKHWLEMCKKL